MQLEGLILTGATWLWDQYGAELIKGVLGKDLWLSALSDAHQRVKKRWEKFEWIKAEEKYKERMLELYSTTRLIGNPKPIDVSSIFTDVYVLEKLTAQRRYSLEELKRLFSQGREMIQDGRRPIMPLIEQNKRLFILGKPGAGKTTLLKYVTLQACTGNIKRTPIFVSIKEWADSNKELFDYLIRQFDICSFPNAHAFLEILLKKGNAIVLFDGLDEVKQEYDQRSKMIKMIKEFSDKYEETNICITCRIAATEYTFQRFAYVEIADFSREQIQAFVGKWYQDKRQKLKKFIKEIERPEHQGLLDLSKTPLLLALLCLAYDETGYFPLRRIDLYKETLDALLKRWDASRDIQRDTVYKKLSPVRKEQMLARLAAENFEIGDYFIPQNVLERQIVHYLNQLPKTDVNEEPDGNTVLRSIENQHGILVERAHLIYSFSHLTFQEYLTAKYIVENSASGTLDRLFDNHLGDTRWREVILLTSSLLDNADKFFEIYAGALRKFIIRNNQCVKVIEWANKKSLDSSQPGATTRSVFVFVALLSTRAKTESMIRSYLKVRRRYDFKGQEDLGDAYDRSTGLSQSLDVARSRALDISRSLNVDAVPRIEEDVLLLDDLAFSIAKDFKVHITRDELINLVYFDTQDAIYMTEYLEYCRLFVDCLRIATVSNRDGIEADLLTINERQSTNDLPKDMY